MEIYANGDAPGANQMVEGEGPVIDPDSDPDLANKLGNVLTIMTDSTMEFGDSLLEFRDNFDISIMIKMILNMFMMTVCQSTLMLCLMISLMKHILKRIYSMFSKCANLILIGAAVTGMMYAKRYFCPEAQTSF